jgi:uncharacterized protein YegP (UPF0339 family)
MPDFKIIRRKNGKWGWRLRFGNEKILDASSQGFTRKNSAKRNFERTRRAMNMVTV